MEQDVVPTHQESCMATSVLLEWTPKGLHPTADGYTKEDKTQFQPLRGFIVKWAH